MQFDVFLGYDGIIPAASWFPVVCEVRNDGPTFTGTIEVTPAGYRHGMVRSAVVELPTGTLKRVVVPVFSSSRYASWDVRLLDQRRRMRAEQLTLRSRKELSSAVPLMGALSRTPGGTPAFRPILPQNPDLQPVAARLLPSIFPDNPLALDGLQSIFLSSESASELNLRQVEALLSWLYAGGHLIVGVEQVADVTSSPWLNRIFPLELTDIKTVEHHPELQQWLQSGEPVFAQRETVVLRKKSGSLLSPAKMTPFEDLPGDPVFEAASLQLATGTMRDGRVLASSGTLPLMAVANRGEGQITALLFNPEREPARSWTNLPSFWAKLADVPVEWYASSDFQQSGTWGSDGIFGAMLDSRQVQKLPVFWLVLLLLVYLAVIGPFDRYWLKRIRKPMLTWITFPSYVVFFSLLIYYIGYWLRSGESEWNELQLVDVLQLGDRAEMRGRTFASVYSPSNQRYRLQGPQRVATLRGEFVGTWSGTVPTESSIIIQNGDSFRAEVSVPVWSSQLFVSDWWQTAPAPLKVTLHPENDGWTVAVENRTAHDLAGARLVVQRYIFDLPIIPAQQRKEVTLLIPEAKMLTEFVSANSARFTTAVQSRQHAFGTSGQGRLDDLPNGAIAASFLSQAFAPGNAAGFTCPQGFDLSPVIDRGGAVIFLWMADYSPVQQMHQFNPRRSRKDTMWRIVVDSL